MLNKLTTIPTVLRLSLSLMASAAMHAGAAYYDWASRPATVHNGNSAVVVALVTAADNKPSFVGDAPQTYEQQKTHEQQKTAVEELMAMPKARSGTSTTAVVKAPPTALEPKLAQTTKESGEEPLAGILPNDPVCIESGPSLPGHQAEAVSTTDQAVVRSQGGIADASAQLGRPETNEASLAAPEGVVPGQTAGLREGALVEAMPDYRNNPLPEYPFIARQRHWQGVVWLLVDVSAKGLVDDVALEQSCGYRVLDRAATRAVQGWEFIPAKRAGVPVASQVRIPVRFSLEGS